MSATQIVMAGLVVIAVVGMLSMAWTMHRDRRRGDTWAEGRGFFGGGGHGGGGDGGAGSGGGCGGGCGGGN